MPGSVTFPSIEPQWVFNRDCVLFYAIVDDEIVKVLVSAEALETHFGAKGLAEESCMRAFRENRVTIEEVARRKILSGSYKRGDEVLLKMADFARTTTTTTASPRTHSYGLVIKVPAAIVEDPFLLSGVNEANSVLQEELVTGAMPMSAHWDLIPVAGRRPLVTLTLTDQETETSVTGPFTADDLAKLDYARFSLFRLWDDLLRERGRKQLEALQDAPASGGSR
jgi:hypothetical protein